jgi:GntR family transcriptional regulator
MQILINANDGVPIYQQIVNQIKHLVASGRLAAGGEIPPIRVLAHQLLINPNTVARAYLELEREGVVQKRHGTGTYIAESSPSLPHRQRKKLLNERVDALLVEAAHLDVSLPEVLELIRERQEKLRT